MASRPSKPKAKAIPLADAADIERRRQESGITEIPRNSGKRRTQSKKALLKAIESAGGRKQLHRALSQAAAGTQPGRAFRTDCAQTEGPAEMKDLESVAAK